MQMTKKFTQFVLNHWILVTAFTSTLVALFFLFMVEAFGRSLTGKNRLTPFQATRLINNEKAMIIDVRDWNAYSEGHIINAIHMSSREWGKNIKRLEQYKHQPLIMVCSMSQKSRHLVNRLHKQGYEKVYILMGGMRAWRNANMPVVK